MPELADIRTGLAARLNTIPDLQASAYVLSNPTPPAAHVFPEEVRYDMTFGRGHDDWMFVVQVFVAMSTDIGAQKLLDRYLAPSGTHSVKAAIESGAAIVGVEDLRVVSCSRYGVFTRHSQIAGPIGDVYAAEWRVQVLVSGT